MAEEKDKQKQKSFDELYQEFQDKFSIDKLKGMTLEVYTNDTDENGFIYWMLNKFGTSNEGNYTGCERINFGIYKYKNDRELSAKSDNYNNNFAWKTKQYKISNNATAEEAFEKIREYICEVAENAHNFALKNEVSFLQKIDDNPLPNQLKWKIAFLFSDTKLIGCYSHKKLRELLQMLLPNEKIKTSKPISDLQYQLAQMRDKNPQKFYQAFASLWEKENNNNEDKTMTDKNTNASILAKNLAELLTKTKNIILHGAPGTGKTYLAKDIASYMNFGKLHSELNDKEKQQFSEYTGFVQFHPSYDYTDFVEGLRPVNDDGSNGQIGFERRDGVFKEFCEKALQNYLDSQKTTEEIGKEKSVAEQINSFVSDAIEQNTEFEIATGNKFKITDSNEKSIYISIPANEKVKDLVLRRSELSALLSSEKTFENGNDIRDFFSRKWRTQQDSYIIILYKKIKKELPIKSKKSNESKIALKNFVFIIDEINRGELSKIFGELFFAIDPGYRGKNGKIRTQYANMQDEQNKFDEALEINDRDNFGHFFVPDNVYIIGTMNDIDRSVESMDFAMRRRFTFREIKANENTGMLDELSDNKGEARNKMTKLNDAIAKIPGLSSAYHIGAAYFLKLKDLGNNFDNLWKYHLDPLLREYLRGQGDVEKKIEELHKAYKEGSKQEKSEQNPEAAK